MQISMTTPSRFAGNPMAEFLRAVEITRLLGQNLNLGPSHFQVRPIAKALLRPEPGAPPVDPNKDYYGITSRNPDQQKQIVHFLKTHPDFRLVPALSDEPNGFAAFEYQGDAIVLVGRSTSIVG